MEVATKEKNSKCKPSPNTGKVAALADERGKCEQKRKNENKCEQKRKNENKCEQTRKNSFSQNGSKYLPVILERRKNAVGNSVIKKYGVE